MDRTFTVTYTIQIIRSARRHRFWRQKPSVRDLCVVAVLAAFFTYVGTTRERSMWVGPFGFALALTLIAQPLVYVAYQAEATEQLRKMGSPQATVHVTDESIGLRSGAGTAETPWRTVKQLWTFADVWLVFVGKDNYFTLPTADLDDEAKAFIRQMVTQNGGKVR